MTLKLTIDASVHLNALHPREDGSTASRELLERIHTSGGEPRCEIFCPTVLVVEVCAGIVRALDDPGLTDEILLAMRRLPNQTLIPLSELLAEATSRLAAKHGIGSGDAIYGAVAELYGSVLVTRDANQLDKLAPAITVWRPEEALRRVNEG